MKVQLIARSSFLGGTDFSDRARDDQLRGTDLEQIAEYAGRVCYDSMGKGRNSEDFAANILEHNHPNVLYHSWVSFHIEGVSRNLTHELVRHHVGFSPSMRSTRFCDEGGSSFVTPLAVKVLLEEDEDFDKADAEYHRVWRAQYRRVVQKMLMKGHDKKTAHGAAARYLPNGIATQLAWSGNLAAFRSMIERRSVPGVVDAEFCQLSAAMLSILKVEAPAYFKDM
jgi:thymidylate synthase (FAD)